MLLLPHLTLLRALFVTPAASATLGTPTTPATPAMVGNGVLCAALAKPPALATQAIAAARAIVVRPAIAHIPYAGKRILGWRIGGELPDIDGVHPRTDPILANICVRGGGFGGSFPRLRECAAAPVSWHRLKHVWMGEASGNALRD